MLPGDEFMGYFCVRSIRVIIRHSPALNPLLSRISLAHAALAYPTSIFVFRLRFTRVIRAPLLKSSTRVKSVQNVICRIRLKPNAAHTLAGPDSHEIHGSWIVPPRRRSLYHPRLSIVLWLHRNRSSVHQCD